MILISLALSLAPAQAADCKHIGGSLVGAELSTRTPRAGDRISVHLFYRDGPDGEKDIPPRCVSDMRVTGPARLGRDGAIEIAAKAKAGDLVTLSMRIGGSPSSRTVTVIGADQQVLIGKRSVSASENCPGRVPAEIDFGEGGRFVFTYPEHMVETMTSGAGTYSWNATTQALTMSNNAKPGTARFVDGKLVLEGIYFDWPPLEMEGQPAPPPCRIVLG